MSEPTKEQIERAQAVLEGASPWGRLSTGGMAEIIAQALADEVARERESVAEAALAPPAQTQQGLSEEEAERKLLDEAAACIESEVAAADDDKHPTIRAHAHVATRIRKWLARHSNLEKQPSPAAAPAQLSDLAIAQRGLDEWCKAAMQERARADAAEARLAALAGQPARDTSLVLAEAMEQGEKDREAMGRQHDSQKLPGRIR